MERRRNGFRACLALAAILSCLVGRDVLFEGRTFTPTDFLSSRAPWGREHSSDVSVRNRVQQDVIEFDAMHALAAGNPSAAEGSSSGIPGSFAACPASVFRSWAPSTRPV
jgi:hypothetical protein